MHTTWPADLILLGVVAVIIFCDIVIDGRIILKYILNK
jgi:hypothetical protein